MADYYYDFDYGDDTNAGTFAAPFKNLTGTGQATSNANFNPSPGDFLYLARGSEWNLSETQVAFFAGDTGTVGSPVTMDAYDNTNNRTTGLAKPIINNFQEFVTGDWTLSGTSGVWYADMMTGTSVARRLFFNNVGQKTGASSIATCTATTPWWFDNAADRVYVHSGSDSNNPTDVHGDVKCTYTALNAGSYIVLVQRAAYITLNNLTLRGGDGAGVYLNDTLFGTDTGGLTVNSCDIEYFGHSGIQVNRTVAQDFAGVNTFQNNTIDKKWSTLENVGSEIAGNGVTISAGGFDSNLFIEDNTIIDATHSGINITIGTGERLTNGVVIKGNTISCLNSEYGRGLGINCVSSLLTNTLITGNYIYNTRTRNQIEGIGTKFIGNIIDGVSAAASWPGTDQGVSTSARDSAQVEDVVIANNIILNTNGSAIRLKDSTSYPITSYSCYNNIAIGKAGEETIVFSYEENDTTGALNIKNNIFIHPDTMITVDWDGTEYTVVFADIVITYMSGNLSSDPLLNSNYIPQIDSPCIGAGTINLSNYDFYSVPKIGIGNHIGAVWPKPVSAGKRKEYN